MHNALKVTTRNIACQATGGILDGPEAPQRRDSKQVSSYRPRSTAAAAPRSTAVVKPFGARSTAVVKPSTPLKGHRSAAAQTSGAALDATGSAAAQPLDAVAPALLDKNTSNVGSAPKPVDKAAQRKARYALRQGLSRLTLTPSRVAKCGRVRIGDVWVETKAGRAYYTGVLSCGAVWLCPVCAAKIAMRRTAEVERVLSAHLAAGGGVEFVTTTMPHGFGDLLAVTRRVAADSWRRVLQSRGYRAIKDAVGIAGVIRTLEVTHGRNGWHPHFHALVLTERPLSDDERAQLLAHIFAAWRSAVVHAGQPAPLPEYTTIDAVRDVSDVAAYVTKVKVALEVTQGAAKLGRRPGQRTPFAVLADFLEHGDADDLAVWQEWQRGIKGAKQLTWSKGLRERYRVADVTDEALAAEAVDGEKLAPLTAEEFKAVCRTSAGACAVLEAAERGGVDAVRLLVAALVAEMPPYPYRIEQ